VPSQENKGSNSRFSRVAGGRGRSSILKNVPKFVPPTLSEQLKALAPPVDVLLANVARGSEQMEAVHFEAKPTLVLAVRKVTAYP
jgi:hypothetical protein